ncbi:MAG: hypothetical protein R3Y59_04605 [bacterium]
MIDFLLNIFGFALNAIFIIMLLIFAYRFFVILILGKDDPFDTNKNKN